MTKTIALVLLLIVPVMPGVAYAGSEPVKKGGTNFKELSKSVNITNMDEYVQKEREKAIAGLAKIASSSIEDRIKAMQDKKDDKNFVAIESNRLYSEIAGFFIADDNTNTALIILKRINDNINVGKPYDVELKQLGSSVYSYSETIE